MATSDSESCNECSEDILSDEEKEEEQEYEKNQGEIVDPRVKKTIEEMLEARGYTLTQEVQEEEVKSLVGSKVGYPDLHVLFATDYAGGEEVKFNVKIVTAYLTYIRKKNLKHVIIIHQGKAPSARVNESIKQYIIAKNIKIETFPQCTLKYNPTKHRLVPKHEAMSKEEGKNFKGKYGDKFNKIKTTDPIVRFYGFEKGDVVVVYRKDGTVNYRIVI